MGIYIKTVASGFYICFVDFFSSLIYTFIAQNPFLGILFEYCVRIQKIITYRIVKMEIIRRNSKQ